MTRALWEIMPQSVRNEQCNSTITDAANDSKTAAVIGGGGGWWVGAPTPPLSTPLLHHETKAGVVLVRISPHQGSRVSQVWI